MTLVASGESFSLRGVSVTQLEDGKIVRHSDYYDLATLVVQFGIRFAAPPPTEDEAAVFAPSEPARRCARVAFEPE